MLQHAGYAAMRWAQTAAVGTVPKPAMPNVFMATAADLGQPGAPAGGPHVRDKQDVGRRLALAFRVIRDQFISANKKAQRSIFNWARIFIIFTGNWAVTPVSCQCPVSARVGFAAVAIKAEVP